MRDPHVTLDSLQHQEVSTDAITSRNSAHSDAVDTNLFQSAYQLAASGVKFAKETMEENPAASIVGGVLVIGGLAYLSRGKICKLAGKSVAITDDGAAITKALPRHIPPIPKSAEALTAASENSAKVAEGATVGRGAISNSTIGGFDERGIFKSQINGHSFLMYPSGKQVHLHPDGSRHTEYLNGANVWEGPLAQQSRGAYLPKDFADFKRVIEKGDKTRFIFDGKNDVTILRRGEFQTFRGNDIINKAQQARLFLLERAEWDASVVQLHTSSKARTSMFPNGDQIIVAPGEFISYVSANTGMRSTTMPAQFGQVVGKLHRRL